jgi:hypothetical protein
VMAMARKWESWGSIRPTQFCLFTKKDHPFRISTLGSLKEYAQTGAPHLRYYWKLRENNCASLIAVKGYKTHCSSYPHRT